ncbi:SufD family Fe-S cluster assembly protein [Acholeplasma sp. OttesenSCG-928-E16]|nr:SufD family Fe-S cluster assembly protein [Acholeplasma sp. OttesenSCG-928-E16]
MKTIKANTDEFVVIDINEKSSDIKYHILDNARLKLVIINNENSNNKISIDIEKDAYLNLVYGSFSFFDQTDININLKKEGSNTDVKSLAIGNNATLDININVNHQAKDSKSDIYSIGIANKKSNIIIKTIANIQKNMVNSNSYQKIVGSILDDESRITGDPVLYIDEYDVVAGHGAAVGKLDSEAMFYLMSRGISKEEAKKMLLYSMMTPFLDSLDNKDLVDKIMGMI